MDYINYILNDASNNDKELVKELSFYVRNHSKKRLPIDKTFVKDIVDIILRNSEIEYSSIILFEGDEMAYWDVESKSLVLNITKVLNISKAQKKDFFCTKTGDAKIFSYYLVLDTIIHELTHARQYYLIEKEKNKIYDSCDRLLTKKYAIYSERHDDVLYERYANLRGNILSYQILSYVYPQKYTNILKLAIMEYLTSGYNFENNDMVSALDTYNQIMEDCDMPKVNIDFNEDTDFYSRLYLGLPISSEEYEKLINLYCDIFEGKKQTEDIKKLINKL